MENNTMTTYGDFFTGGGGMTQGAIDAGLDVVFGVEYDADIASVYRANFGDHIHVADLTTFDVTTLPPVDIFHASPPCTNASVANASGEESPVDLALSQATCDYIRHAMPRIVTIENVTQYREFESWRQIARTFIELGYTYKWYFVTMTDYGVPQKRKRMIAIARRDGESYQLPEGTHEESPTPLSFWQKPKWVSWYEAIEDLIPTLETAPHHSKSKPCEHDPDGLPCRESRYCWGHFAKWQLSRLPDEYKTMLVNRQTQEGQGAGFRRINDPSFTVTNGNPNEYRAFIMNAANANSNEKKKYRMQDEPAKTVTASDSAHIRAFVTDILNYNSKHPNRMQDEPIFTMTCYSAKHPPPRAYTNGRIVKMSPRCIARFQSFPDTYWLPSKTSLAVKVIGNAVPPLFAKHLYKELSK